VSVLSSTVYWATGAYFGAATQCSTDSSGCHKSGMLCRCDFLSTATHLMHFSAQNAPKRVSGLGSALDPATELTPLVSWGSKSNTPPYCSPLMPLASQLKVPIDLVLQTKYCSTVCCKLQSCGI